MNCSKCFVPSSQLPLSRCCHLDFPTTNRMCWSFSGSQINPMRLPLKTARWTIWNLMADVMLKITERAAVAAVAPWTWRMCDLYNSRKRVLVAFKKEGLNGSDRPIYLEHCYLTKPPKCSHHPQPLFVDSVPRSQNAVWVTQSKTILLVTFW